MGGRAAWRSRGGRRHAAWLASNVARRAPLRDLVRVPREPAARAAPRHARGARARAALPRWMVALVAAGSSPASCCRRRAARRAALGVESRDARRSALRLGLAVVGLILVEQLMRRAHPQARWAIKPLCVGLAGVFGFDLFFYADAMLFGRLDADIWVARGVANALVIPFLAVATARNTGVDDRDARVARRGVPLDRAARVGRVPARRRRRRLLRPLLRRRLGPRAADRAPVRRAARSVVLWCRRAASARSSRSSSASISSPTATTIARSGCASRARSSARELAAGRCRRTAIKALADLVESPGGALWLRDDDDELPPGVALEHGGRSTAIEPADGSLAALPRAHRLGHRPRRVRRRADALSRARRSRSGCATIPSAWLVVPLIVRRPSSSASSSWRRRARAIEVNWEVRDLLKTASRQAASYPRPAPRDRGAARGAQVRRLQPDVGVCRPRSQEPGGAAFADAHECRAPPRQSRVPARHAGDGRSTSSSA